MRKTMMVMAVAACLASAAAVADPVKHGVTITVIGTNDLHGALERLPILGGFIANVRAARKADGGGVLLVDAGDLFQGTIESNLNEGADVVRAYNELGYQASAVGNHEFDYGPVGPDVVVKTPDQDARGALKARAKEAKFPFLVTNITDKATGKRIDYPNMPASTIVEVAGVKIGIVGASTESTPTTTMPANFLGLSVSSPVDGIAAEAAALRAKGAQVIVAVMHIGGTCTDLTHPDDVASCNRKEEVWKVVDGLPKGAVDIIVAGHTHAPMAARMNGIAVIESYSSGRAFGRVDIHMTPDGAKVDRIDISPPHDLCPSKTPTKPVPIAACLPGTYEGKPVKAVPGVQKIVDEALSVAGKQRSEALGVTFPTVIKKSYGSESAEGNLFCDLMLEAEPKGDVCVTNGGGLRKDLPAGALTYGQLFEAMPFDNRFALVDVSGANLRTLVTKNIQALGGILSWGGLTAVARCKGDVLDVQIKVGGKPLDDAKAYKLVTSDFLASGGDRLLTPLHLPPTAFHATEDGIRDGIAAQLRKKKVIDGKTLYNPPALRRLDFIGDRPVRCGKSTPLPDDADTGPEPKDTPKK
ncbi:MAG TPA: bifunctional UDP-sugar hydrolase/5'-nucleotidase [Kofleriaceae bacterium]